MRDVVPTGIHASVLAVSYIDLKTYSIHYNYAVACPLSDSFPLVFSGTVDGSQPTISVTILSSELQKLSETDVLDTHRNLFLAMGGSWASGKDILRVTCNDQDALINISNASAACCVKWCAPDMTNALAISLAEYLPGPALASDLFDMNVKLIKWRSVPELDLSIFRKKIVMVGSGTLGCAVALTLLGYGFTNIHFIDCGTVSYSNISRQWLLTMNSAEQVEGKAKAACTNFLGRIPSKYMELCGGPTYDNLAVPMPGRATDFDAIDRLSHLDTIVMNCDALFLVTDSRESRYLPTVLAAKHNKPAITAAIGFDSYLCNLQLTGESGASSACYFCGDSQSIGDSIIRRPLDEQCTVTRPGCSPIASATAAEMLVSYFSSPDCYHSNIQESDEGILGKPITRIRGWLNTLTSNASFESPNPECLACSSSVITDYNNDNHIFLQNICTDNNHLSDISGLTSKLNDIDISSVITLDDV